MNAIELRFAQLLHQRVTDDLSKAHNDLGSGTQIIRDDAAASGMNCARLVGKIEGLRIALRQIDLVDAELHGRKPADQRT